MEVVIELDILKKNKMSMEIIKELLDYCKLKRIEAVVSDKKIKILKG